MNEKIQAAKQTAEAQGFTPQELGEAVLSTTWTIECECGEDEDPDGKTRYCNAAVTGTFRIRGNLLTFETSDPDFELEITDGEDDEEDAAELTEAEVDAVRAYVEAAINEKLESATESAKDDAKYDYADSQYRSKVGEMAYHGVSWSDFV